MRTHDVTNCILILKILFLITRLHFLLIKGVALLKRNIHTLEDELSDANTVMEEKNKSHAMWKEDK